MALKRNKKVKIRSVEAEYEKYFRYMQKQRKQPMTFYHWKKSGRTTPYYKGLKRKTTRPGAYYSRKDRKAMGMAD